MHVSGRLARRRAMRLLVWLAALCGSASTAFALTCPRTSALVPVFEQRSSARPDALLTTDPQEGYLRGYQQTRLAFYALPQDRVGACPSGTNYVFRVFNPKDGAYLYTTDYSEVSDKLSKGWQTSPFIPDMTNFCIADKDETACNLQPLMRLNSTATPPRPIAYTTSAREVRDCLLNKTCTYDPTETFDPAAGNDVIGRVWPKPTDYVIRIYPEPYQPLVAGPGVTSIAPDTVDANTLVDFPSGFSFAFYGRQQDSVYASTNGFLTFDYGLAGNTAFNLNSAALPGHMPPYNVIAGWWEASFTPTLSSMLTKVTGSPGSRHVIIQWGSHDSMGNWLSKWDKFGTYAAPDSGFGREMQVHLVEGTNRIEFHYGPKDAGVVAGHGAAVGISGDYGIESLAPECSPTCSDSVWPSGPNVVLAIEPEPPGFMVKEADIPTGSVTPLTLGGSVQAIPLGTGPMTGMGGAMVDLGFSRPFEFDGQKFTQVGVSSVGAMSFLRVPKFDLTQKVDPVQRTDIPPTPDEISHAGDGGLRDMIAPWWDRLSMGSSGQILFTTTGSGTNHVFIVEWQGLLHETITDMWGTHVDKDPRTVRVELHESDNSIKIFYLANNFTSGDFPFDTATAGIINFDRDGRSATYRLMNCTPWCTEGTGNRDPVAPQTGNFPLNMVFTLTPDTHERPTWTDVAPRILAFTGDDACVNCHTTLTGKDYVLLARVLGNPAIDRPGSVAGPPSCAVDGTVTTTGPLLSLDAQGDADVHHSWFADATIGLSAMSDPGGAYHSGGESSMPWPTWCSTYKEMPNIGMANDDMKSIIRRWVAHNTP